jgi:hypothetical protein
VRGGIFLYFGGIRQNFPVLQFFVLKNKLRSRFCFAGEPARELTLAKILEPEVSDFIEPNQAQESSAVLPRNRRGEIGANHP